MRNKIVFSFFLMAIGSLSMYGAQECLIESRKEDDRISEEQIQWLVEVGAISLFQSDLVAREGASALLQIKMLAQLERVECDNSGQRKMLIRQENSFFQRIKLLAQLARCKTFLCSSELEDRKLIVAQRAFELGNLRLLVDEI